MDMCSRNTFTGANLRSGGVNTVEAALKIFLNVKVRKHKKAQLDIVRCIVHIKVDNKNASKNHDEDSDLDQTIKATPWQTAHWQECSSHKNFEMPCSSAKCSDYFKASAPRDINNHLFTLGKKPPTQTFHIWFHKRRTLNRLQIFHKVL